VATAAATVAFGLVIAVGVGVAARAARGRRLPTIHDALLHARRHLRDRGGLLEPT
jgi:hypothetical protein